MNSLITWFVPSKIRLMRRSRSICSMVRLRPRSERALATAATADLQRLVTEFPGGVRVPQLIAASIGCRSARVPESSAEVGDRLHGARPRRDVRSICATPVLADGRPPLHAPAANSRATQAPLAGEARRRQRQPARVECHERELQALAFAPEQIFLRYISL
jgi:hypothetical protein